MIESLFTSQTPVLTDASDGTPGITSATTVVFAVDGTVSGMRFFATTTVSGTYTGGFWRVDSSDPGGGTLLRQKTMAAPPTGGTWNSIIFDTPVAVTAGVPYRVGIFSDAGRYVATVGFPDFSGAGLTNGNIFAPPNGAAVGAVVIRQGVFRIDAAFDYPNGGSGGSCYFADVLFEEASGFVDLAADLTATGTLSAAMTREAILAAPLTASGTLAAAVSRETFLAAPLTATGTLAAGLTREALAAAALTATGTLTAGLDRETALAAALTATGSLTVATEKETTLSAALTATGSLSVAMTVPNTGPPDLIASPVAAELLACFTQKLNDLPSPPKYIQMRVGQDTGPLIGPGVDECCSGLAWVRVADVYPSWDSFPQADNTWTPCGPLAYAVVLEMGMAFCMPWSTSEGTFEDVDPPSTADWAAAHATQMRNQNLMRQTAACCFRPTQRRAVGGWTSLPVEGGCTGGKLTVTVSVMNPCSDC